MTTLNEAIQARIATLEAQVATLDDSDIDVALMGAEIGVLKMHLIGLAPWLHCEVVDARDSIDVFFIRLMMQ